MICAFSSGDTNVILSLLKTSKEGVSTCPEGMLIYKLIVRKCQISGLSFFAQHPLINSCYSLLFRNSFLLKPTSVVCLKLIKTLFNLFLKLLNFQRSGSTTKISLLFIRTPTQEELRWNKYIFRAGRKEEEGIQFKVRLIPVCCAWENSGAVTRYLC